MKKHIAALLCLVLAVGLLAGCGAGGAPAESADGGAVRIVVTIFPIYDWVRQLLGDEAENAELTMLMDSGVDLHSYQPSVDDVIRISNCDLFIYVGGESDGWVDDALKEAVNPDMRVINLLDALGSAAKAEETVEGMEPEEEEEGQAYDEHVWLSLRNAQTLCGCIADALSAIDPAHAGAYAENLRAYDAELAALDAAYAAAAAAAPLDTVLFGDRFPFRYLTDDYGLNYYAAFAGCSAETEASFETVVFLAGKIDELGLGAILQIETADGSVARTIRDNTASKDQQILTMDSLQSATAEDAAAGVTYLSVMEENLGVLRTALGG